MWFPRKWSFLFIYTSNRNTPKYDISALSPGNPSTEVSDSLSVLAPQDGTLGVLQYQPAGGIWPRHIKLNKAGGLLAASLQNTHRVAILERDVETGLLGDFVAHDDGVGKTLVTV
ncbi:putative extracellular aldonolactonase [Diaporthe ampelina]|uniref:Putative extracellular aldonolactonase n=1 Tax=Diaporthe ampelina TaxID=1214573 RepID=A0A0G2HZ18_9PEZI|nr:putative extracellular aldonolactonase [Diaporthe ampelina]